MKIKRISGPSDAKFIADIYRSDMGKYGTSHTLEDIERVYLSAQKGLEEIGTTRIGYLLFDGKRPVGTIQLLLERSDNDRDLADGLTVAHIHHLRVAYDLHKRGLGKKLMASVEEYAKKHGYKRLTLGVDDWNINAIGFYFHLGYKILKEDEGRKPGYKVLYLYKDFE